MENFLEVIKNRKSVKYYKKDVKIKRKEILQMLNIANTAPSAYNLQPWRYIVVDTKKGKEKLKKINYNKTQAETSSLTIIVMADKNFYTKFDDIYSKAVSKGYMDTETKDILKEIIEEDVKNTSEIEKEKNITFEAGLWTMQFCNVAKSYGYDTNILAGFDKEKLKKEFNIEDNYNVQVLITLGKKEKEARDTVRIAAKDIVKFK